MSRKFSISYFPHPIHDHKTGKFLGNVFRPTVPIQISYKDKKTLPFQALVDSGSDINLFPAKLGEILDIKVNKGKEITIEGIGKVKIKAYKHKINLYIENCIFETEIYFIL